jgi:hypothetical protein
VKKKFIGPANPGPDGQDMGHDLVVAGRSLGTVRSGDVIEVPADLAASDPPPQWPDGLWEDVADKTARKKSEGED